MKKNFCIAAVAVFPMLVSCDTSSTASNSPKMELVYSNENGRCYVGSSDDAAYMNVEYDSPFFTIHMDADFSVSGSAIYGKMNIYVDNEKIEKSIVMDELCKSYKVSLTNQTEDLKCFNDHIEATMVPEMLPMDTDASQLLSYMQYSLKSQCKKNVASFGGEQPEEKTMASTKYPVTSCVITPSEEVLTQRIAGDGFNIVQTLKTEGAFVYEEDYFEGIDSKLFADYCAQMESMKFAFADYSCANNVARYSMAVGASEAQEMGAMVMEYGEEECQEFLSGKKTIEEWIYEN